MTSSDWATVIYSYTFVTGALGGVVWFILKKAVHHVIEENLENLKVIRQEVTPNHGSSMNDAVKLQILPLLREVREAQIEIKSQVDKLEGKFEQHIEEHSK